MVAQGVGVELYDETGLTRLAFLTGIARAVEWEPALENNGTASFELPAFAIDATGHEVSHPKTALVTDRRIVKFRWRGDVFSVRVGDLETCQLAVDGGRWLRYENLQGSRCLAGEGTMYPEYGVERASSSVRRWGHMSRDVDRSTYGTPLGVAWEDDPTARSGFPEIIGVVAPRAQFIAASDPTATSPPGTENWFYAPLTVDAGTYPDGVSVKVMMVFDNYGEGFLDGEFLFEATDLYSWKVVQEYDTHLAVGDHLIASKVKNAPVTVGLNPVAFLCVVATLNVFGEVDETSTVLLKTNTTDWQVSTVEPGFSKAGVLALSMAESQARGERGPGLLIVDFTATADSAAQPITDSSSYEFQTAQAGNDELAAKLAEAGADCLVDHEAMKLQWFNRYGSDLTATVRMFLAAGVKDYDTTRVSARRNVAIGQLADGSWLEVVDTAAVAEMGGRVVMAVDLGSTASKVTGEQILTERLTETSAPLITVRASPSTLVGPQYGVHFGMGDTILLPGHRAIGTIGSRCMGAHIDAAGEVVIVTPRFVQDRSVT